MVLIVDDDTALAAGLERFFRFAGLDAVACPNGMEALALLAVRRPALIVLDLHMPAPDGLAVLRAIRRDKTFKSVPVVMYTSDFAKDQEDAAIAAGAQAYFVKGTIGMEALLARVRELIGGGRPPLRLAE
jgi:DNA-binding response OmpR family regulator